MVTAAARKQPRSARPDPRRNDLAAIHMAKAKLGWSEDEYRDVMATVCGGIRSAADLDISGRKRFLAHLQACVKANSRKSIPQRNLAADEGLMWSLWMQLADVGAVEERSMAALTKFARRQTKVDQLGWLNDKQAELVIESLKKWLFRAEALALWNRLAAAGVVTAGLPAMTAFILEKTGVSTPAKLTARDQREVMRQLTLAVEEINAREKQP